MDKYTPSQLLGAEELFSNCDLDSSLESLKDCGLDFPLVPYSSDRSFQGNIQAVMFEGLSGCEIPLRSYQRSYNSGEMI